MKIFSAERPLILIATLFLLLIATSATGMAQTPSANCQIPASGPWPPCATGGQTATQGCVIPPSGPWPPCATGGAATANNNSCVIPPSGPWPACARAGGAATTVPAGTSCQIPASGPWPPCATAGSGNASSSAAPSVPALPASIALTEVASGFQSPVFLTHAGEETLYVVEKFGRIKLLHNKATFLDINRRVRSDEGERGLLSMAFHPNYRQNGRFFVYYTDNEGDVVVSEFRGVGDSAEPNSERILLTVKQPFENHNGGQLAFGRDGFLYIGLGDGGAAGDPFSHGRNPETLLGAMLRIDVNGAEPYTIPAGNPYRNHASNSAEIWAIGLRNPWRFSFDQLTGDLYIGDVGQDQREEINFQANGRAGLNYGWNAWEGTRCFLDNCSSVRQTPPVAEYAHDQGCSVTGGYVYRGSSMPNLYGVYFYADYCNGNIWATTKPSSGAWQTARVADTALEISSFGEDAAGELYVIDFGGKIYRLTQ